MKQIEIGALYGLNYRIKVLNALEQYWRERKSFCCLGAPKPCHMLLYLEGGCAHYTTKNGAQASASDGALVYLPQGAEYTVCFEGDCRTVHINFLLEDEKDEPFSLGEDVCVLYPDNVSYGSLFSRIDRASEANIPCYARINSLVYELFFSLSEYYHRGYREKFRIIANGIACLEEDAEPTLTIAGIAERCHVSEVYFRKLFKEYAGVTPTEYRMARKIARAKAYLRQGELSVAEISDRLGFSEVSYFIRVFKAATGITPKQYGKQ